MVVNKEDKGTDEIILKIPLSDGLKSIDAAVLAQIEQEEECMPSNTLFPQRWGHIEEKLEFKS